MAADDLAVILWRTVLAPSLGEGLTSDISAEYALGRISPSSSPDSLSTPRPRYAKNLPFSLVQYRKSRYAKANTATAPKIEATTAAAMVGVEMEGLCASTLGAIVVVDSALEASVVAVRDEVEETVTMVVAARGVEVT